MPVAHSMPSTAASAFAHMQVGVLQTLNRENSYCCSFCSLGHRRCMQSPSAQIKGNPVGYNAMLSKEGPALEEPKTQIVVQFQKKAQVQLT